MYEKIKNYTGGRLIPAVAPSILIGINLFLIGPFTVYQGNHDEFTVALSFILEYFWLPALIVVFVLTGIGLLSSQKFHERYVSIIFALGILMWMQGNILIGAYGPLDGQAIDDAVNAVEGDQMASGQALLHRGRSR